MSRRRKIVLGLLKLTLGVGIITLIAVRFRDQNPMQALEAARGNWPWLLAGAALCPICLLASFLRWHALLSAQGIHLTRRRVFCLGLIGHFFNAFMLGATGGDLIKAYYISRETRARVAEGIATVVVDRLLGLLALIALADVMALRHASMFLRHDGTRRVFWLLMLLSAGTLTVLALAFSLKRLEQWSLFRRLETHWPAAGGIVQRLYDAFYLYRSRPGVLGVAAAYSLANHLMIVLMAILFARALDLQAGFIDLLTLLPVANIIGGLPLTPGGLGVREGAYVFLLGTIGVLESRALVLSLLVYASFTLWSIVGGVVFMLFSSGQGQSARDAYRAAADA